MNPRLSILIATTPDRRSQFNMLKNELIRQSLHGKVNQSKIPTGSIGSVTISNLVEIHWHEDNKILSIGQKRQAMIKAATGDYVAHFDSDDWPAPTYVTSILKAIETNPDTVGIHITVTGLSKNAQLGVGSMNYSEWCSKCHGYDYVRSTYHKNPIRRDIAIAIGFKDMRYAEDHDYSKRLINSGLLKSEVMIKEPIYVYRYSSKVPASEKYGIR